jgi:hypothetical protein
MTFSPAQRIKSGMGKFQDNTNWELSRLKKERFFPYPEDFFL